MGEEWASIPWESFTAAGGSKKQLGWRKQHIPYRSDANALQTLDVWIQADAGDSPPAESLPARKGPWVIYIHGGAWRDPAINASSFAPTATHLFSNPATRDCIAGLASLSYSLSAHPTHATDPSPPKDPGQKPDPSRTAKHPDHITDMLAGLEYLQRKAGFGDNYVLVGHSCGATLAFQAAMNSTRWYKGSAPFSAKKPKAILGLNGLYDLVSLIREPGTKHEHLASLYESFVRIAFGEIEDDWKNVSPVVVDNWAEEWGDGVKAILAQSLEDTLVPYNQTELMLARLKVSAGADLKVSEVAIQGDHNEVWQSGERLAEVILELVKSL